MTEEKVKKSKWDKDYCWDSGLKVWQCWNCGVGVLEKEINVKPEACLRCGNPDLTRDE